MGVYSGNRTLLGESTNTDYSHIMEMVIESERNDLRMFEAVINCDFIEAYNEAGIISLTEESKEDAKEETKKGIGQKIKELFKKAIESVKRFIATFVAKLKNMFANDAKLYKQYKDNFENNGEGYTLHNWRPINYKPETISNEIINGFWPKYKEAVNRFDKASSNDEIAKEFEKLNKELKERDVNKEVEDKFFKGKVEETYKLSRADVSFISTVMKNSTRSINTIKAYGNSTIVSLENDRKELKYESVMADEKDELGIAKLNAKYKAAGSMIKITSKSLNAVCNTYARYLAQCRKAFALAGKKSTSKADDTTNEAYDFILGEASDDYVEKMLLTY